MELIKTMKIKTTDDHKKYWKERKIDWAAHYLATWDHPHRKLIMYALKQFTWFSLWEVGCGPGPNLVRITKELPGRQLGGSDINEDAIELAKKTFVGGNFRCEASEDLLLSDNSVDVVLSDAHLIYYGPQQIKKVLKEMIRVSRSTIVLCEYQEKKWWKRLMIRLKTGYNAHNYPALLEELGCHSVRLIKIPKEYWPDTMWGTYGHIIIARKISI